MSYVQEKEYRPSYEEFLRKMEESKTQISNRYPPIEKQTVSFGKYKGQKMNVVLSDKEYVKWISNLKVESGQNNINAASKNSVHQ